MELTVEKKDMMCDHETGRCMNGCNAGMIGDLCNISRYIKVQMSYRKQGHWTRKGFLVH